MLKTKGEGAGKETVVGTVSWFTTVECPTSGQLTLSKVQTLLNLRQKSRGRGL